MQCFQLEEQRGWQESWQDTREVSDLHVLDLSIWMIPMDHASKEWEATISHNKQKAAFKLDAGAQCNMIWKDKYKKPVQSH